MSLGCGGADGYAAMRQLSSNFPALKKRAQLDKCCVRCDRGFKLPMPLREESDHREGINNFFLNHCGSNAGHQSLVTGSGVYLQEVQELVECLLSLRVIWSRYKHALTFGCAVKEGLKGLKRVDFPRGSNLPRRK
jgi:hypothetical protein